MYYRENTEVVQINVVADVSKAFFDILLSQRQLTIVNEDIKRLQRSLRDAYNRYQAGVVDKTDYKQATIALNNSLATRKQTEEAIKSKTAYLKQIEAKLYGQIENLITSKETNATKAFFNRYNNTR